MTEENQQKCSCQSNVQINDSASETNENTSLLNPNRQRQRNIFLGKVWLCTLLIILAVGVITGAYLLLTENEESTIDGVFNLIPRDDWGAIQPLQGSRSLSLPVTRVMFLHTNTSNCFNEKDCTQLVQSLQIDHMVKNKETDILYNFIITGNGLLYEGRGWNFESYDNRTVMVALVGNFDNSPLPKNQVLETRLFIDYATAAGKLVQCFEYVLHQHLPVRRYFFDAVYKIIASVRKGFSCI